MATTLAARLRQEIERRNLTMAEAATEIGVTQPTISRWLRGTPPDEGRISALAQFLAVADRDVEELVMQARLDQLERRRSELAGTKAEDHPGRPPAAAAGDEEIELDFNSAMRHVPEEVRQAVIRIVEPYLEDQE